MQRTVERSSSISLHQLEDSVPTKLSHCSARSKCSSELSTSSYGLSAYARGDSPLMGSLGASVTYKQGWVLRRRPTLTPVSRLG